MKKIIIIVIAILIVAAGIGYYLKKSEISYELATVKKGDIVQEVSASGKVEAPTSIDLHFKNSGKMTVLNAKVGMKVETGQLLAKQNTSALEAQLAEMKAGVDVQNARLAQMQAGASPEDIAIAKTAVANAQRSAEDAKINLTNAKRKAESDLDNLYSGIRDILNDAYIKAYDAVSQQTDEMFDNDFTAYPQLSFITANSQAKIDVESKRAVVNNELNFFKTEIDNLNSDYSDLDGTMIKAKNHLAVIEAFLIRLTDAVNSAQGISQATINIWKSNISSGRTNISAAISAISNRQQLITAQKNTNQENIDIAQRDVNAAENNLKIARDQLSLTKAPLRSTDIAVYEAQIKQAKAQMQQVAVQIQDMKIIAPVAGTIIETNGNPGEIIDPGTIVVSMISNDPLQVKVNLSEVNVANVKVGQSVRITGDAIQGELQGTVTSVDPSATIIQGSVYYLTTVTFNKKSDQIKDGMTTNVWIKTGETKSTLVIPASAIQKDGENTFVQIYDNKKVTNQNVTLGLKSQNGMIEIISGLSEGQQVVISNQ